MTSYNSFLSLLQETPYSVCELDVDSVEPLDTVYTVPSWQLTLFHPVLPKSQLWVLYVLPRSNAMKRNYKTMRLKKYQFLIKNIDFLKPGYFNCPLVQITLGPLVRPFEHWGGEASILVTTEPVLVILNSKKRPFFFGNKQTFFGYYWP